MSGAKPNKSSPEWRAVKAKMQESIDDIHQQLESISPDSHTNFLRGQIFALRQMIDWVEPTKAPTVQEDAYGVSDPDERFFP